MIGLKKEFEPSSLIDWEIQLKKELKGADFSTLLRNDKVEEISYPTFFHKESGEITAQSPAKYPYTRGYNTKSNAWGNGQKISVTDEADANQKALSLLMKGCDLLILDLGSKTEVDCKNLFRDILLDFIKVQIIISNEEQYRSFQLYFGDVFPSTLSFNYDYLARNDEHLFSVISESAKENKLQFCYVDGYAVQQCGATTWQEIAFCISVGHEYLIKLMGAGFTIDQAAESIHFSIGIGSNYFLEIAKIRALRQVWSSLLKEYDPKKTEAYSISICAQIGFMNKSLIDPYTNLLRQTTEAMSAIVGGVESVVVFPYDSIAIEGKSTLSERMALNISLILKEESYFDCVIDPLGGSYAIENLTQTIAEKSWEFFQILEEKGGLFQQNTLDFFKKEIHEKAEMRKKEVFSNDKTLIGINKYLNSSPEDLHYKEVGDYLGMEQLIFERELISTK